MDIRIICVGKIKEKFYRDAIAEYSRRLGPYISITIDEAADEATPDSASPAAEEQILRREGERILKKIPEDAFVTVLAIKGKRLDSVQFSDWIKDKMVHGTKHLVLIIGGSLGLSREVLARADYSLSFSDLTFPHQLMRVILLEQIYRAFRIMRGEPYHK